MKLVQAGPHAHATPQKPSFQFDVAALLESGPLLGSILVVIMGLTLALNYLFSNAFNAPPVDSAATMRVDDRNLGWSNNAPIQDRPRLKHYVER